MFSLVKICYMNYFNISSKSDYDFFWFLIVDTDYNDKDDNNVGSTCGVLCYFDIRSE